MRADTATSAVLFDLEPYNYIVANVQEKATSVGLEIDACKVVEDFRSLVDDLVKNYRGPRSRAQNMMLVLVVLIICIPSVLDAFVEKRLVAVDSGRRLFQGEDVFWWFWWMLRTACKVIHARASYSIL